MTGSKFLIEHDRSAVLVDCGLFQGPKALRKRNWEPPPFELDDLDAVVVTHAHVDHVGAVPRLTAAGYRGPVYATHDTVELSRIVLPDSGHLHEEEAEFANRRGFSKHRPALPLYTEADARRSLGQFRGVDFHTDVEVAPGVHARFRRAGHILGAASITLSFDGGPSVVFSGDLGTGDHPILVPPDPPEVADVLVCESTYGDRDRPDIDVEGRLGDAIATTARQGGTVVIPAFSVDRTEMILWHLAELERAGAIPDLPIYVDSPMASAALDVYRRAATNSSDDLRASMGDGTLFRSLQVRETKTTEQSIELNGLRGPMIIVSASGMATGGRVLHHLDRCLGDPVNSVILVGFQAPGTRGRSLLDGADSIKFFGRYHPVRADVVEVPLSAHADRGELLSWIASAPRPPDTVYLVHGEADSAETLASSVTAKLGLNAVAARSGERVLL